MAYYAFGVCMLWKRLGEVVPHRHAGPICLYWRGTARDTTRAILPGFVVELSPAICGSASNWSKFAAIARGGYDSVVIIDSWGKDAFLLAVAKTLIGFRLLLRLRGDPMASIVAPGWLATVTKKAVTRIILARADALVFNSQHVRSQPNYRRYAAKSHVVYNPLMYGGASVLDGSEGRAGEAGLRLLSVVSFGWMKKIRPLGEAIERWIDAEFMDANDITWTICGVGDNTDAYRWFVDKVHRSGRGGRVRFIGYQKEMPAQYRTHDVLVHLSGLEAFPNAVLEASYYELPTITIPESGGTLEAVINGSTGRIVVDGLTFRQAVLDYLNSPELRREHGRHAREHVHENFTIETQKAAMATLLLERFGLRAE